MSSDSPTCLVLRQGVPSDWHVLPLSAVTDFQEGPGILAKDFHSDGVPLLRLRNIETPVVHLDDCNFLDPVKVAKRWPHFALREGDLLISTSASLGRVSVVDATATGSIAYTGIIRFRSSMPASPSCAKPTPRSKPSRRRCSSRGSSISTRSAPSRKAAPRKGWTKPPLRCFRMGSRNRNWGWCRGGGGLGNCPGHRLCVRGSAQPSAASFA
jgi:hypothetical protein